MPPKKERLSKKDFSLLGKRKTHKGHFFDIVYVPAEKAKVGCVALKKRIPNAVDRNRVKRKLFHLYRENKPKTPFIIIFYPKPESSRTSTKNLQDELRKAFATL